YDWRREQGEEEQHATKYKSTSSVKDRKYKDKADGKAKREGQEEQDDKANNANKSRKPHSEQEKPCV
ncbi:unnamed protein product, partial [marine sediment metagenome]